MISFVRRPSSFLAALPLLAGLVVGAPPRRAHAQFGGLLKKAAEKAVDKATGAEDKVSPNVQGAELTDEALNRLIKGLGVTAGKLSQRDALQAQLEAQDKAARDLEEPNAAVINAWYDAHNAWDRCMSNEFSKFEPEREAKQKIAMNKLMADQKRLQAYGVMMGKLTQERQDAMASGDTLRVAAAEQKLESETARMLGLDISADSAKARGTCGPDPVRPSVMARIAAMKRQRDTLQVRVRDIESTSQIEGAKAAGMPLAEFALQKEKAAVFVGSGTGGGMLTRDELNRLRAKRAELEKVKKAL